jgi:hypothetical protein
MPDNSDLPLIGGPEFPIGIFWPPPPDETTAQRYRDIADAGFTFVITGNYLDDSNIINWALSQADRAGLKVLISDDTQLMNLTHWFTVTDDRSVRMSITTADGQQLVQRMEDAYGSHPSLAGYNLYDEPQPPAFPSLANAFKIVRTGAPNRLTYINLLPDEGFPPGDYEAMVEQFIQTVQPLLLSFDRYPILTTGLDTAYFQNWVTIRQLGLKYNLPTWTFIQAVSADNFRTPSVAERLWLINISLAYGCTGIQYFTYWTPDPARGENFGPAIINLNGNPTERYQGAKTINTRWLSRVGRELKPLVSERVVHFDDPANPGGVTAFTPDAYVTAVAGDPVIIGQFTSPDPTVGGRWLLVVNRAGDTVANTMLWFGSSAVTSVGLFDPGSQTYRPVSNPGEVSASLQPGAATLYRLR